MKAFQFIRQGAAHQQFHKTSLNKCQLINTPSRGLFNYSNKEYKINIAKCLNATQRKVKTLRYKRLDNTEVKINLYGYPVSPVQDENLDRIQREEEGESQFATNSEYESGLYKTDFMRDFEKDKPNFQIIQIDPMRYLYRARSFAVEFLPNINEQDIIFTQKLISQLLRQKLGVFGQDYKLSFEKQDEEENQEIRQNPESLKKIHSLFFPYSWRETQVSIETLLMLNDPTKISKEFIKNDDKFEEERNMLLHAFQTFLMSPEHPSIFHDLNRIIMESVTINQSNVLMGDMPDLLNRMQIGATITLKEMQEIFSDIMNKIKRGQGPIQPGAAALYHYPEIFQKRKDQYLDAMIRDVLVETDNLPNEQRPSTIDVYCGNIHVSPLSRLWNTTDVIKQEQVKVQRENQLEEEQPKSKLKLSNSHQDEDSEDESLTKKPRYKNKKSVRPSIKDLRSQQLGDFHKMQQNHEELAEHKIEKQALMEALFQTQLWNEPYVKNPFLYVTDHDKDFEGPQGEHTKQLLQKIFYANIQKYENIVESVLPKEYWEAQEQYQRENLSGQSRGGERNQKHFK
eukprot:403349636